VQLLADEIAIHAFIPDDGSESAAVKITHRTSQHEVINHDTNSQWHNFRHGLFALIASINPNPDHIPPPKLVLFDHVRVNLPQSVHEGQITRLSWDYARSEWQYFVQCPKEVVSTWYIAADLLWLDSEEDDDDEEDLDEAGQD
jgi:hypothetical protein